MYNLGDHVLFLGKGKIINRFPDAEDGTVYMIENRGEIHRVPEAAIQQVFTRQSPYGDSAAGCGGIPVRYRRPSADFNTVDGDVTPFDEWAWRNREQKG